MSEMKLSIVIPVYKVEKFIVNTVDSLEIACDNYEIILVDDHSPDDSPRLCDELAAKYGNIKVLHKAKNEGLSMARNSGIDIAKGEYICFVDADDKYAESDAVGRILDGIGTGQNMYFVNMDRWYNDGSRSTVNNFRGKVNERMSEQEVCRMVGKEQSPPVSASLKIIKTELLKQYELKFKPGIVCEDIEWFIRCIDAGLLDDCGYIDVTYLYYQGNSGSITKNVSAKNVFDLIEIIEEGRDRITGKSGYRADCIGSILAFEIMISIYNVRTLSGEEKEEAIKRIKKLTSLMRHSSDKRVLLTFFCAKIGGVAITSSLLSRIKR